MDEPSAASEPESIALRFAVHARDVDAFVAQYSRYLRGDEIFLVTDAPALPGTRVRFTLELANGNAVLRGKGTVTRVHGGRPNLVPGMDVAFEPLDEQSRSIIERMRRVPTKSRLSRSADTTLSLRASAAPPPLPAAAVVPASATYIVGALLFGIVLGWLARSGTAGHDLAAARPHRPSAQATTPLQPAALTTAHTTARATASLAITTRPPGASVTVDGKAIGESPIAIDVAPGSHEVTLVKARYAAVSSTVAAPGKVDIALKRPSGTLTVESTPAAAEVLIQGKKQGKTPLRVDVAAFKTYDVQVAFAGGKVWRRKVYLKAPGTAVQATLAEASLTRR